MWEEDLLNELVWPSLTDQERALWHCGQVGSMTLHEGRASLKVEGGGGGGGLERSPPFDPSTLRPPPPPPATRTNPSWRGGGVFRGSPWGREGFLWDPECGARRWGAMEPRRVGGPKFRPFFSSPATISLFLCLSLCLLVEFWWCFWRPGTLKCARLESPNAHIFGFRPPKTERNGGGRGKKRAKFWAVRRRGVRQRGPPEGSGGRGSFQGELRRGAPGLFNPSRPPSHRRSIFFF